MDKSIKPNFSSVYKQLKDMDTPTEFLLYFAETYNNSFKEINSSVLVEREFDSLSKELEIGIELKEREFELKGTTPLEYQEELLRLASIFDCKINILSRCASCRHYEIWYKENQNL